MLPGETTNSLFGWLGWARTNDLSVNSRLQLPTVLLTNLLLGCSGEDSNLPSLQRRSVNLINTRFNIKLHCRNCTVNLFLRYPVVTIQNGSRSSDSCRVLLNISSICGSRRNRTSSALPGAGLQPGEHHCSLDPFVYLSTFPSADVIIICEV